MTKHDVLNLIDQESERIKQMRENSKSTSTMYMNCNVEIKTLRQVRGWVDGIDRMETH